MSPTGSLTTLFVQNRFLSSTASQVAVPAEENEVWNGLVLAWPASNKHSLVCVASIKYPSPRISSPLYMSVFFSYSYSLPLVHHLGCFLHRLPP